MRVADSADESIVVKRSAMAVVLELMPDWAMVTAYFASLAVLRFEPLSAFLLGVGVVAFSISGLGWFHIGSSNVGLVVMIGRGALALAVILFALAAIGDAGDDYEPESTILLIVALATPVVSALVLVGRLAQAGKRVVR